MWDRATLKGNARMSLHGHLLPALAAIFFVTIMYGLVFAAFSPSLSAYYAEAKNNPYADATILYIYYIVNIFVSIFIMIPLFIGLIRFFVQLCSGEVQLVLVFSGFQYGYFHQILTTIATLALIFLWSLLFYIPGVIKALQYSMVPFILAENPNIEVRRALEISSTMTEYQRGQIFLLYLSFFGWLLIVPVLGPVLIHFVPALGIIFTYIASLFVMVYLITTFTELYIVLRDEVIQRRIIGAEEFGLPPIQEPEKDYTHMY